MTWEQWRPQIAQAVDGVFHTIDGIDRKLSDGSLKAWMTEDCCLLLEFVRYPAAMVCQFMWAAGDLPAILAETPKVEAWAKAAGCTEMLVESRAGWARILKRSGYEPWSVTVRKAL